MAKSSYEIQATSNSKWIQNPESEPYCRLSNTDNAGGSARGGVAGGGGGGGEIISKASKDAFMDSF